jgi:Predicted membrane protein (DUF2243)
MASCIYAIRIDKGKLLATVFFTHLQRLRLCGEQLYFGVLETLIALNEENAFFCQGYSSVGGTFNLVEGIIDHHILRIHHVK